ncbi:rod shape-determining protein MreD [Kingella negevensis]|uniref:Rod shape-determining protein MreD n=1 Tax=Kingella negevensis TaxID=1522312 RepID=A0A238TCA1_9NEIS|nr:rod shape-determining protein MreD [Kingella negevensis]MDK4680332.1 rod shape-determining protein MreD [Kingella negevensis]MDK4681947.1 rod shape-determining protein MreD [Kingella negevensis]MDK4684784.1 rod shape-determining protein MreD [Kingella negevensis]MDK4690143.1 rod shape-determining protein MreD [Kingella negevensis]MDK4692511.1 rod shape-determining protein MreD [Kingella negevensis]
MNESEAFYNKIPKKLIYISFFLAFFVDFIPLSGSLFFWLPEFTALILMYWIINRPQNVGIGTAFILGLLLDIGTSAPLGEHALAYIFSAYIIVHNRRQIVLYNYGIQAIVVFTALMCNEMILSLIRWRVSHHFLGWLEFVAPFVGAWLWPLLNKVMVSILNFRYLRR